MSKIALATGALILAAGGFALGRFAAPEPGAGGAVARDRARPPVDPIRDILADPDAFSRAARLGRALPTLGPEAVPAARAALAAQDLDLGLGEFELLVRFWARHDPEAAARWALVSPISAAYRIAGIVPAIEAWARADVKAALERVGTPSAFGGHDRDAAEIALVRGWFASGQPGLEDYVRDLGLGFARQRALGAFAREWIQRDGPEPVQRWAEELPDEDERYKLEAFRRVASELGKADPAAAVAFCEAHCDGPYGSTLRERIAIRWGAVDGPAALQWLSGTTEGIERDRAVREAATGWARADPEAFRRWMVEKAADRIEPWLGPAVEVHASLLSREDLAAAIEWVDHIADEKRREVFYVAFARRWLARDAPAAEAWLAQSSLSEEAVERVREQSPPSQFRRRGPRARRNRDAAGPSASP